MAAHSPPVDDPPPKSDAFAQVQVAQQTDLAAVVRNLPQGVQRELQVAFVGPIAGTYARRRQQALVAEGCDARDEMFPVLGERLNAFFRSTWPLVAVAEIGNVFEE